MKKLIAICLVIIVLTGCSSSKTPSAPNPEELRYRSVFISDGVVHAVCTEGRQTYLTEVFMEDPQYRLLQEENENSHDVIWNDPLQRVLFTEGYDILAYDPVSREQSLFWEMPEGTRKNKISMEGASDHWIFLRIGYGERKWMGSANSDPYSYYVNSLGFLNIESGVYTPWCQIDLRYNGSYRPFLICMDDQTAYIMQRTADDEISIFSVALDTMRTETVTTLKTRAKLGRCEGVMQDQTLHLISDISEGILSISLKDGTTTETLLKNPSSPEHTLPWRLQSADGHIYVLAWDGVDYPTAILCRWDPIENSLLELSDQISSAENFFIDGNDIYIWSGQELRHVVLASN